MMGGCLVIGSNTGGTIELINNKKTGLLYQCGDIDDLAAKIEYAILNKKEMKEIAENGQKYMLENMTARANAERIFKVYEYINNAGEKIIGKAN
jgi:hypothetical protein